ncbi:unnamed protein product [Acanthoscelides obtectus]|uniref:PROP1-like PPR domain-containing protein n=1 Tax=Acanthoscelides obtectus TaxID=200917 RepID=A0A9P0PN73_ACAOB|nr:unnamed protein product [Acanthoscelides obtectus]CAK1652894.1 Pentatricopeptide repeat-containing protein 1, mitochondrial [Acanthoscelides obtectus]
MIRTTLAKRSSLKQLLDCVFLKSSASTSTFIRPVHQTTEPTQNHLSSNSTKSKEKDFLVKLKTDPDTFGPPKELEVYDEGDLQEERYFEDQPLPSQKLRTKQYADLIKDYIKNRRIKEAIDLVEVRMIKEDRVKPENYIYNLLLGACGRVGYTKKAFKLYNDMKKRGLKVTGGTYTALFNACANSPWASDGLSRAKKLYQIMIEKGYEPNDTNYNAMIKAFGRCGDLNMAFTLVDEMITKGIRPQEDTLNFLFQACITDKDAGFRHALLVWRKVVDRKIKPNIFTYNLMLRSIRECGIGDVEVTQDVINKLVSNNTLLQGEDQKLLTSGTTQIEGGDNHHQQALSIEDAISIVENNIEPATESNANDIKTIQMKIDTMIRPNLMASQPHLGNIISLAEVKKPEERLLLVGGFKDFLANMKEHNCQPDIKTFSLLLDVIPSSLAAEKDLLNAMKKLKVKPDIDFFNMLIKKRSMRFDYEAAKEVLELMDLEMYQPNLITYGVLSLGCKTKEQAEELIGAMTESNYRLNTEILGTMLKQGCYHVNFNYVMYIMDLCEAEGVRPNKKFIETLEEFKKRCRELQKSDKLSPRKTNLFCNFRQKLKTWQGQVKVDDSEDVHPWQQFRESNEENKYYKSKDDKTRFKPRHASRFKVKTSKKHLRAQN